MKLFNLYIFNRSGECLYYREWERPQNTLHNDLDEERKLVFGMLFSLKDLTNKLSPISSSGEVTPCNLHVIKTKTFCLHHYESTTGLMFVMNSDPALSSQHSRLEHIYKNIYIDYVARNPMYHFQRNAPIQSLVFDTKLEEYLFSAAPATQR